MITYSTENIRNLGIVGHSGCGKTILTESILYCTKNADRFGRIEDGNTVSDYELEEKKRRISISASIVPLQWKDIKINLIDMPGYFDFVGEVCQGLRASDIAMIVISGVSGIQVGTEKAWEFATRNNLPNAFYINKLDRENSNFDEVLLKLKEKFGSSVVPIQYPIGSEENFIGVINVISKKARIFDSKTHSMQECKIPENLIEKVDKCKKMIIEAVAETDETLLDKYFNNGTLNDEEIYNGLVNGCSSGEITPVMCGSALKGIGIETLLEDIAECFPSPKNIKPIRAKNLNNNEHIYIRVNEQAPFSSFIFKTIVDPFVGKLSLFKVITGKIKAEAIVYNPNKNKNEKIGTMYFLKGKQQIPTNEIIAGDIGAVSKLQYTFTGDTLCDPALMIQYDSIKFPDPLMPMAILPKSKNDEDKISNGLNKLLEEDPTFKILRDLENAETVIYGVGETHLEVIACKLKNKFGAEVTLKTPQIPYRETIKKVSDVQGKHKKQSGGHGQYGDVKIKFEPRKDGQDDLMFVDEVVGGVVPRQYIPAVEKGLKECINHGVLAGYPVIRLKATLHDGSYHPVDSSEMAFKIATSIAYKKGLVDSEPVLLEPIMHVEITVPEYYMGDIIADINKKRGRVIGMEAFEGKQKITAEVPQVEMLKYATDIRSITQARGSFLMRFERYEEVPSTEINKVINDAKNLKDS
ncbi:elongation factor G [Clostridium sp. DJ247]|uniref:elongation factor G n=1 Tax=Clostridium sp. DJ247 TaxID=2726188 RepID=UPI0016276FDE|nr:elongation factor G [Clostridium sp. DJ247]MBC2582541.1 elongation factor G [Clostridium sp. DJ247]